MRSFRWSILFSHKNDHKKDLPHIPIYQKLKQDLEQYNNLPSDYTYNQLPITAQEALKMFNNHLSPKDHERDWWMSLVEQDNHANYMKNDECCGVLPYWRPYNTENGAKACCGKVGEPSSYKTYSIDFFTCCEGETKSNGEGGCLAELEADRLDFQARSFTGGRPQSTISYTNSKPTGNRLHIYDPFIDEREDNDFEEDEKDPNSFKIIPNTYNQDEDVIGTPVYKTTAPPEVINVNIEEEKPSSFDADIEGDSEQPQQQHHQLSYEEWARSFKTGGLDPIDIDKNKAIDDFQDFVDNNGFVSLGDLDSQEIDTIYSALSAIQTPLEPLDSLDVKSPSETNSFLSLRNAGAGDSDMDSSEYWDKDQCLVDLPMAFSKKLHKIEAFCQEKEENGISSLNNNNYFLYPDRSCRFYINCDSKKLVNCGQGNRFNGYNCVDDLEYSDTECGQAMNDYNYGMVFERKASTKTMNRNGQETSNHYLNQLASLNYDDSCIGQNPDQSDDYFCATQCGCSSSHCKGCTEQDQCLNKCKYKTEAGYTHKSKKYLFCKHLKPLWSNDNNLWTDWTCKSYVHCQSNEDEIRTCPENEIFSARDNRCIVAKAGKKCGQWFISQARINRNYRPTWNREKCVFSV